MIKTWIRWKKEDKKAYLWLVRSSLFTGFLVGILTLLLIFSILELILCGLIGSQ